MLIRCLDVVHQPAAFVRVDYGRPMLHPHVLLHLGILQRTAYETLRVQYNILLVDARVVRGVFRKCPDETPLVAKRDPRRRCMVTLTVFNDIYAALTIIVELWSGLDGNA
jgi:hypothetical protein